MTNWDHPLLEAMRSLTEQQEQMRRRLEPTLSLAAAARPANLLAETARVAGSFAESVRRATEALTTLPASATLEATELIESVRVRPSRLFTETIESVRPDPTMSKVIDSMRRPLALHSHRREADRREIGRLRKRVKQLEDRLANWESDWYRSQLSQSHPEDENES